MPNILIFHSDNITAQGIEIYLSNIEKYRINIIDNYSKCLDLAKSLNQLEKKSVVIADGKLLDSDKLARLVELEQTRVIICDCAPYTSVIERKKHHNSLVLALNYHSSCISLEHNDPQILTSAIECALVEGVFICPQIKKKLNQCVYNFRLEQCRGATKFEAN